MISELAAELCPSRQRGTWHAGEPRPQDRTGSPEVDPRAWPSVPKGARMIQGREKCFFFFFSSKHRWKKLNVHM